jgi:teichuronic acid biosynthesis glycosyltransferase TuaG
MSLLVSIVLPAYQAERTLEKAISSIVNQTYPHWELIIVVDAATDATPVIADIWAKIDARIRILFSKKNRGVVRSRNIAIRLAKGDLIAFCDADDWWDKNKLERQLQFMLAKGANFCYTAAIYVGQDGNWMSQPARMPAQLDLPRLLKGNPIGLSTAVYDSRVLGKHYFEKLPLPYVHEDYAYWLDLFQHPIILSVYDPNPEVFVLMDSQTRSGNKLLALRSQFFILRKKANFSGIRAMLYMVSYLFLALHKRGWKTWWKQLRRER